MAITKSLTNLIDGVRFAVRRQTTGVLPDADVIPLINQEIRKLWILCGRMNRDEFWKVSGSFTIAAGANTKAISAIPVTDFLDLRGVDISVATNRWASLKPWKFSRRGAIGQLSYRYRGVTPTIEILPFDQASSYTYRIHYTYLPAELTIGANTIDLPMGGDEFIVYGSAAKVRPSFMEDPSADLALQQAAEVQVKRWLSTHGQGPAETVPEASPYDDNWDEGLL